jgi:nicotinate-nucleotide pyrophosphorylase (carboxylating)
MTTEEFIRLALEEDVQDGDHTSLGCIPAGVTSRAHLLVKDEGILAGIEVALEVFRQVDKALQVEMLLRDGAIVKKGDIAFVVSGSARSILMAERLVLNLMQRMSGIATTTGKYVKAIEGYKAKVLDTRKTTPLLRYFEKLAVKIGGGENHRFGLYDMVMIKDNHIDYAGGIKQAITSARIYLSENKLELKVEIEARNLEAVKEILAVGEVDRIMLDNFTPEQAKEAVELIAGRYEIELSGGITLDTIRNYAATGADYISVGALTHSVKSLDLSLKAF